MPENRLDVSCTETPDSKISSSLHLGCSRSPTCFVSQLRHKVKFENETSNTKISSFGLKILRLNFLNSLIKSLEDILMAGMIGSQIFCRFS